MIKKLSQRIFFLIMISLSVILLSVIGLLAFINYRNTMNTATLMMDRFMNIGMRRNAEGRPEEEKIDIEEIKIDGFYYLIVENSRVMQNSNTSQDKTIENYAISLAKGKKETGIIGNYIYKVKKIKDNTVSIALMEDANSILHIKMIFIFSGIIAVLSLLVIYAIAKKVSKLIVNPVKETFEKQKQFISDASHELKTPLAVIEANADVLENEIGNNKWMKYIQNEIESMNKLINELLLLAKIENIDSLKEYKQLDVSKETEIIISMFESMAYEKKVTINSNIQENIIINSNKEDLEHMLSTLIDNAIKHTNPQKEIIIELVKEKNEIVWKVKNMGDPIPEEEREKIFERFYRMDKSRNRKEKRYGLGLSIAKSTVEKYKGKIEVSYENGFTIFKVTIPI